MLLNSKQRFLYSIICKLLDLAEKDDKSEEQIVMENGQIFKITVVKYGQTDKKLRN